MNNPEAKFILCGYRPNGRDAGDAMFGAALKQAESDPALGAWFARSQAHDGAVARKLAEIAPPAGLREAILAGARVSGTARSAWKRPVWLAMAAAAAVMIGVAGVRWPNRAAAQAERVANFALTDTAHAEHGGHGAAAGALQRLLSQPTTRLGGGLPVDFAALQATGCRTVSFAGKDVLEVCFQRNGSVFHLYVFRSADFPRLPTEAGPAITHREGLSCATWGDAGARYHYAVVSSAGADAIRSLL
jgi:hypothetical protein